jgi:hypothetical protein
MSVRGIDIGVITNIGYNDGINHRHDDNDDDADASSAASSRVIDDYHQKKTKHNRQSQVLERKKQASAEIEALAARETILIRRWKIMLIVLWLLMASAIAVGTYTILHNDEQQNYDDAVRAMISFYFPFSFVGIRCDTFVTASLLIVIACGVVPYLYHRFIGY